MPTAETPFTFGVWLELPPDAPLAGQGIVRLLSMLLRTVQARSDVKIVIALPGWTAAPLRQVLALEGVDITAVEFLVSRKKLPVLLRLRRFLRARRHRPSRDRRSLGRRVARRIWGWRPVRRLARPLLATGSPIVASVVAAAAGLGGMLILLFGLPVALMWRLLRDQRLVRAVRGRVVDTASDRATAPAALPATVAGLITVAGREVVLFELERLCRKARRRRDIRAWLVPLPGSAHAAELRAPLVVAVPDLVYVDFPTLYPKAAVDVLDARVRAVAERAAAVVSYCEHVRSSHVVRHLGVAAERAHVIVNAPMNAGREMGAASEEDRRAAAAAILAEHFRGRREPQGAFPPGGAYLVDFPFAEIDFIFASSQVRPHKNYVNLIRAFTLLLRRKRMPIKLFFTGRWEDDCTGMRELVASQRLWLDVVSVPDLPPEVHAAFYRLAAVTVVPTLFEGGIPFPFTESMSVGTPVVMSSIPVTRERIAADLAALMLFDPYDPTDMAEKIAWALDHRQALAERQQELYATLCRRTWDDVAREYLALLRQVAARAGSMPARQEWGGGAR